MSRTFVQLPAIGLLALLGLTACNAQPNVEQKTEVHVTSPDGASPPAGLDQIRKGMPQSEVLAILRPTYDVIHAADAEPALPIADFFPYREDGVTKYIEISYDDRGRVDWIRFGFGKTFVLE